jgi:signal transduction histidine kinase
VNTPAPSTAASANVDRVAGDVRRRPALALETLESLLALPASDLVPALTHACNLVARAVGADKVDAFLYDEARSSLVAIGSSTQPLSDLEKRLGLDVLPVANGGRVVHVYQTGQTFVTGHLEDDDDELRGVKEALKVRSTIGVPLEVGGKRRGMLMIASQAPERFSADDVRFAELVVRWVGMVAHRAELVEEIARTAAQQGRRAAAEDLMTVLAHDLRNFVAPIGARLNLVRARAARDARKADVKDADAALAALRRLGGMIGDIMDAARIEQGIFGVRTQPLDLAELTRDVAGMLSTPDHAVEVAASTEPLVAADPDRLRQCLENVITNAVQHSPDGAPVTITLWTEPRDGVPWARLEVRDEGPGIAPDVLPHIFDRFVSSRRSAGLGLGLYLARRIVEAHGGELSVDAAVAKGACFTLRLPCLSGS